MKSIEKVMHHNTEFYFTYVATWRDFKRFSVKGWRYGWEYLVSLASNHLVLEKVDYQHPRKINMVKAIRRTNDKSYNCRTP